MWKTYPSIKRVDTEEAEGILEYPVIFVEPKIDGANASVFMNAEGVLQLAKRTDVLKEQDKTFNGFTEYMLKESVRFTEFFKKYPNTIIYGEWLVKHTIGHYRPSAYRQFYAYDIYDVVNERFLHTDDRMKMLAEFEINQIPPIVKITGGIVSQAQRDKLHEYVDKNQFLIDEADKFGEGVVLKAFKEDGTPYVNKFGTSHWAKIVRQEFKEKHTIAMGLNELKVAQEWEKILAETCVTQARVDKIKAKVCQDKGTGWKSEYIPAVLGITFHDVFSEELKDFVAKNKVKEWNFTDMRTYITMYTKRALGL